MDEGVGWVEQEAAVGVDPGAALDGGADAVAVVLVGAFEDGADDAFLMPDFAFRQFRVGGNALRCRL